MVPGLVGLAVALGLGVTHVVDLGERWWIVPVLFVTGLLVGYAARGGERSDDSAAAPPPGTLDLPPGGLPDRAT